MQKKKIKATDRYGGASLPDGYCEGDCEGLGYVPVKKDDKGYEEKWQAAEDKQHSDDGFHFVRCNTCEGTGRKPSI